MKISTIGQLRELIKDLDDNTKVIGSSCITYGRGCASFLLDQEGPSGEFEESFEYYDDEGEERTLENVFVIKIEGEETSSE